MQLTATFTAARSWRTIPIGFALVEITRLLLLTLSRRIDASRSLCLERRPPQSSVDETRLGAVRRSFKLPDFKTVVCLVVIVIIHGRCLAWNHIT